MFEFGMPTLIENRTLEDNIALCKELGLSFVELNMNFPEYQIDKIENIDLFYKKADEAGIYYTIHLDENLNVADFNPLVRAAYLETMHRTIEVAKHLVSLKDKYGKKGQPLILNMHMHHGIHITLPDRKVQMYERDFDVYMEYINQFVKMCEEWIGEADIQIAIENTNGFREYEKKAIEKMLLSKCFVLTWDIGHSKATEEIDVPFILEHKDKLSHFHIHDGSEKPQKDHLALGDGEIDLVERLNMAKACNARCVLETKTIEALNRSVEWLKSAFGLKGFIGKKVTVKIDRPLGSYHPKHKDIFYPINYGYIEGIMAQDGEEQDAYVLGVNEPVEEFTGVIIAIIHRYDDVEEKWVVAPEGVSFTIEEIEKQVHFQEQYFNSEIRM